METESISFIQESWSNLGKRFLPVESTIKYWREISVISIEKAAYKQYLEEINGIEKEKNK